MSTSDTLHYRESLRLLAEGYATLITHYDRTIALLKAEQARTEQEAQGRELRDRRKPQALQIDEGTLSVLYRHKSCFLGNTVQLRLFRRLLRSQNQYLDYTELLEQVWEGIRSPSTVRSAVKVLRRQLNQAGMNEVAQAIVGSVPGHYCLKSDRLQ